MSEFDGLQFVHYPKLQEYDVKDHTANGDLLWNIYLSLRSPRPAWVGMMQMIHKDDHPGQSSILFLPIIDMNSSDMTCLYTTLLYVSSHAKHYGVTPILTFDQPLWWKALIIQKSTPVGSEIRSIILRLGGSHTGSSWIPAYKWRLNAMLSQKYLAYHYYRQKQVRRAVVKKTQQQKNLPIKLINLPLQNLTKLLVNRMFYQCLKSLLLQEY